MQQTRIKGSDRNICAVKSPLRALADLFGHVHPVQGGDVVA